MDQHSVSIVDRLIPAELSSHLDGAGFIVKKKCDCSSHTATLNWGKKGSNHLRISNFAFQKNRMEVIGVGITKDLSDRNWFLGMHGQGTGDQDQHRHGDYLKNARTHT